jgi:hypothetical protein
MKSAMKELNRSINDLDYRGVNVYTNQQGRGQNDEGHGFEGI